MLINLRTKIFLLVIYFNFLFMKSLDCFTDITPPCRTVPGLTKDQLELCYRFHDVTFAALEGLELAIRECQHQFQWNRWNCSSLNTKSRNPHTSNLLKRGYRESAFAYAISAAGVAHSVARACSQGKLISCGCDPSVSRKGLSKSLRENLKKERHLFVKSFENNNLISNDEMKKSVRVKQANRWKWGGCSHNMDFGVEFSEMFLDSREKASDIQSKINLHNNHAGRKAVSSNMQLRCKCHGMSGSCQLKTCWKSAPDFRIVGKVLKQQFRRAVLVDQSNLANGKPIIVLKKPNKNRMRNKTINIQRPRRRSEQTSKRELKKMESTLFYYQRSPNFCERDQNSDILGTVGRQCNRTSDGSDSCSSMCCGRGYHLVRNRRIEKCNCIFNWCCYVECDDCIIDEWLSVCN